MNTDLRHFPIAPLMALALLAGAGCSPSATPSADSEADEAEGSMAPEILRIEPVALEELRLTYETATVRDLVPALELPAEIIAVPDRVASITPPVAGRIVAVRANEGDRVVRGDLLVALSSTEVGRARADIIAARARVDVSRQAAERARNLQVARIGPQRAVEETAAQLRVAEAELQAAMTRLQTYGATPEPPDDGDPAGVFLATPVAGTVVRRTASVGQWAEVTDQLLEVVDLRTLWLLAMVYERDLRHIELGQEVRIQVRAFPEDVFIGHVDQVAGRLDEATRTAAVRVVIPNGSRRLRPGMFASARIQGTHAHEPRELLTIPWSAVQEIDGHHIVFVRAGDGVFEPTRVHTGEQAGGFVEVLSGLRIGDEVVVDGSVVLKGQLLRSTLGEEE